MIPQVTELPPIIKTDRSKILQLAWVDSIISLERFPKLLSLFDFSFYKYSQEYNSANLTHRHIFQFDQKSEEKLSTEQSESIIKEITQEPLYKDEDGCEVSQSWKCLPQFPLKLIITLEIHEPY